MAEFLKAKKGADAIPKVTMVQNKNSLGGKKKGAVGITITSANIQKCCVEGGIRLLNKKVRILRQTLRMEVPLQSFRA